VADILRGDPRFETLIQILEAASATSGPPDARLGSEGITFGGAPVVERDIQASNGIVHVLDAVNLTLP